MSNHFHLLIEQGDTSLSTVMGMLLTRYSKYLNARLDRCGHVFQSRYKTRLCGKDQYFKHLVRYIHLNPVRAGLVRGPEDWRYSGHREYLGHVDKALIDQDFLLSILHQDISTARRAYLRFIEEGMLRVSAESSAAPCPNHAEPKNVPQQITKTSFGEKKQLSLEEMALCAVKTTGIPLEMLRSRCRMIKAYHARKHFIEQAFLLGYTPTQIARYLSITRSSVSKTLCLLLDGGRGQLS